jgi:hypothetical protein
MGTPIDFIYDNDLQWQASLKDATRYRGALIITPGKVLSADKQLPPKSTLKQAIAIADSDNFVFLAGELETFDDFPTLFERYKSVISADTLVTLFVIDLDADVKFVYEGVTIYAFVLDESSVWNELVDYADLSKGDLKKLSAEEKVDTLYSELKSSTLRAPEKTYEEACTLKSAASKTLFGAV